ncbi:MAG: MBL fold metallo-hydrolase [Planctomycetota bacterium]|mgnify:FL=1|nr:MBL fold metallo-hydrolase [Planctomycetota bacterium]MDG2142853.1 MBL fold metallo-hydrolase [Planctomycetota bacterium]
MHLQVLSSGSGGNCTLVRAGEVNLLIDAGLTLKELELRFEAARFCARNIHHIALTHGHLDHARSSGSLAKRTGAILHLCERLMRNKSVEQAPKMETLRIGTATPLPHPELPPTGDPLELCATLIPHDAVPTVAFRLEHKGRRAVYLTDMGEPAPAIAGALRDPHLLVLEFNHDPEMLRKGPYPINLKKRVAGRGGHLSNDQGAEVLGHLAGPNLHTLILAHLSLKNNTRQLAVDAAEAKLAELGLEGVEVIVADQDQVGRNIEV